VRWQSEAATPLWIHRLLSFKLQPKRRRRFALPMHSKSVGCYAGVSYTRHFHFETNC